MVGRRQMADGGLHQGHGGKEEAGAVDPSRDERRRGPSRVVAACGGRNTKAAGIDAGAARTGQFERDDTSRSHASRAGIVFAGYSTAVAR